MMLVYSLVLRAALLVLVVCWPCCIALSASNSSRQRSPELIGNRYLFIVENSSAMEKRDESLRQTMFEFINTGMRGRMQAGDTFGVWTFNSQPETRFPMQIWTPSSRLDLATRVNIFLKEQGYRKRSNIERVWRDLEAIIASVDDLTVVLVTDGNDRISGTPFDKEINGKYRQLNADPTTQKEAFVTAFMLKEGQFVAYSVNRPSENLGLPPAPERAKPRSTPMVRHSDATLPATAPTPPPPVRRVPSIIVTKDTVARENDPLVNAPQTPPASAPSPSPVPAATTPPQKTAPESEPAAKSAPPDVSRSVTPPPTSPPVPSGIVTPNPRVRLAVSPGTTPGAATSVTSPIVVVSPAVSLPPLPETSAIALSAATSSPPSNAGASTSPSTPPTTTPALPVSALQVPQLPKTLPPTPAANPTASTPPPAQPSIIPNQPTTGVPANRSEQTTAHGPTSTPSPAPMATSAPSPATPVVPPAPRLTAQILPPTGTMPVQARSLPASSNAVPAVVALAPSSPAAAISLNGKLVLAALMLAGAAGCFWVHRQRVRQARQTSFISRALPRSPSASATGKH